MSERPASDAETDDRFPSGDWTGFYCQPDTRQRYAMNLSLHFSDGKIAGEGDDVVGEFSVAGHYRLAEGDCAWTKQYAGQHAVEYEGAFRQGGIVGTWRIDGQPEDWCGPFFIWPAEKGDLRSSFESAYLDYELAKPDE